MKQTIYELLSANKNIILVGKTDSGKTYFTINELIPFLKEKGIKVKYYKNMNEEVSDMLDNTILIFDEFEILEDKEYLEKLHPEESPYYSGTYIAKVNEWLSKAKSFSGHPRVFIVSRDFKAIEHLKKIADFDFADNVRVVEFKAYSSSDST